MNCCLCNHSSAVPHFNAGEYRFVRCATCGLIYVANFTGSSATYQGDEYFVRKNEYVRNWDAFCATFEHLMKKITRYKQGGNFLDVGAGVGVLLHVAEKRGFTAFGVEVSDWASAYARNERGLNMVTGTLEQASYPDEQFDVIVINHVLEHVPDPSKLLAEAKRILRNDGLLVIGVPNIGSIMARILREKWPSLRPEEHIWHFTPETLRTAIKRARMREVWFEARDNYDVQGWNIKAVIRRIINGLSVITNRSEAMLLFCQKESGGTAGPSAPASKDQA